MQCQECSQPKDDDAAFCASCGDPVATMPAGAPVRRWKAYLSVLFLVAVLLALLGVGYYKFILPDGIIAVVNGEELRHSELETAVKRLRKSYESNYGPAFFEGPTGAQKLGRLRSSALNDQIRERIALQEAQRLGVVVSDEEATAAGEQMQKAAGMDAVAFAKHVRSRYGQEEAFLDEVRKRIIIERLVAGSVTRGIIDPQAAQAAVSRWFKELSARASVRIALPEQLSAAECGCCSPRGEAARTAGAGGGCGSGCGGSGKASPTGEKANTAAEQEAVKAGLAYWKKNHGVKEEVTAKVKDFGCHMQVDILKSGALIASLRYQNGVVTVER